MRIGFSRVFFRNLGGQTGNAAHNENQLARRRWKAQVVKHRGDGAVHIDRKRLDFGFRGRFQSLHKPDTAAFHASGNSHSKKNCYPRVGGMDSVPESRQPLARLPGFVDREPGSVFSRDTFLARALQRCAHHLDTGGSRTAVLVTDRQHPCRYRSRERLPVPRRNQPCRGA